MENIHCLNSHETSKVDTSILSVLAENLGLGKHSDLLPVFSCVWLRSLYTFTPRWSVLSQFSKMIVTCFIYGFQLYSIWSVLSHKLCHVNSLSLKCIKLHLLFFTLRQGGILSREQPTAQVWFLWAARARVLKGPLLLLAGKQPGTRSHRWVSLASWIIM